MGGCGAIARRLTDRCGVTCRCAVDPRRVCSDGWRWDCRAGPALAEDHLEHSGPIAERVQIAASVNPLCLKARDLGHTEPGLRDPQIDLGLYLEAGAIKRDVRQAMPPECVVAVAKVRVRG